MVSPVRGFSLGKLFYLMRILQDEGVLYNVEYITIYMFRTIFRITNIYIDTAYVSTTSF